MEESMYRKKAMQIESTLLNKIAAFGQSKLSKLIGVDEAQICRMKVAKGREKNSFFKTMSMMLAVLEYGIEDDEMAELTKRLASYLSKEKAPKNGEFLEA
ncbi:CII family transcriptional regulator [Enterobacter hormaechei]|uniref:CII family transcriptional regulator n=1 Tax=Enterobacter hormaechei TaxID=158836 RepID=UPI000796D14C|nr:CII family transcriptional regulator [Enterobacter hormaechei]CZY59428.1 bacteriophage CII family protein [Enterobacter hormaechei]CZY62847.1 bacteriophage CII family protein [Enterobacter hormaechei]CZY72687.1 bacteriophage CII family protein [Enterobacter hormaechei]SAF36852.1 bacteriophage CII family protein [Enterobacter hormaechei]